MFYIYVLLSRDTSQLFLLSLKSLKFDSQLLNCSETSPCNIKYRIVVMAKNFHILTFAQYTIEQYHPFMAVGFPDEYPEHFWTP
jgi:hypothetical protein